MSADSPIEHYNHIVLINKHILLWIVSINKHMLLLLVAKLANDQSSKELQINDSIWIVELTSGCRKGLNCALKKQSQNSSQDHLKVQKRTNVNSQASSEKSSTSPRIYWKFCSKSWIPDTWWAVKKIVKLINKDYSEVQW